MSTRCRIGLKVGNKVESIYCHHDGYPRGIHSVGQTLKDHYNDLNKIKQLMDLGDISGLGENPIADPKGWDLRLSSDHSMCIAYSTRGDTDIDKWIDESEEMYAKYASDSDAAFVYLYKDGAWHMLSGRPATFVKF